jgi:membrane protein DedA with SNARE-associated domain
MSFLNALPQSQAVLGLVILLATFVYEDGATLLAATLSASGRLNPWFGLATTFVGIWVGDLGLYVLGSTLGRRLAWSSSIQKYLAPASLARAERWFTKHGSFALVMSRAIPGSRLPLYTAAGALRLSLRVFAKTTALCSAVWVGAIFAIWRFAPNVSSAHSTKFSFALTAALLFAPWAIAKFRTIVRNTGERPVNGAVADTVCAL